MTENKIDALHRFHVNQEINQKVVAVDQSESRHITKSLRLKVGDRAILFDGLGSEYLGTIVNTGPPVEFEVSLLQTATRESRVSLTVYCALPKGDRQRFLIEKLTELGATRFVPISTSRSVVKPGTQHVEKFQRYVVESTKQCRRQRLMQVDSPLSFVQSLKSSNQTRILLDPSGTSIDEIDLVRSSEIEVFIGPEGGFTNEEIAQAIESGVQVVSMGQRIMRVETAALCVASRICI